MTLGRKPHGNRSRSKGQLGQQGLQSEGGQKSFEREKLAGGGVYVWWAAMHPHFNHMPSGTLQQS